MRKIIILSLSLLPSFFTNAANYMDLGNQMRITFSDDLQTAVVVNQKNNLTFRYYLTYNKKDEIDNSGTPYSFYNYKDERCRNTDKCDFSYMGMSIYTDKLGGATVSLIDASTYKVSWHTYVAADKITKD